MSLSHVLGYQLTQANLVSLAHFEQAVGQPFELRPVEYTPASIVARGRVHHTQSIGQRAAHHAAQHVGLAR
jgi:hypothetical protein